MRLFVFNLALVFALFSLSSCGGGSQKGKSVTEFEGWEEIKSIHEDVLSVLIYTEEDFFSFEKDEKTGEKRPIVHMTKMLKRVSSHDSLKAKITPELQKKIFKKLASIDVTGFRNYYDAVESLVKNRLEKSFMYIAYGGIKDENSKEENLSVAVRDASWLYWYDKPGLASRTMRDSLPLTASIGAFYCSDIGEVGAIVSGTILSFISYNLDKF